MALTKADVCVIYNAAAGRGAAQRRVGQLRRDLGAQGGLRPTSGPGEAEALAVHTTEEGFPIIAAAGGDGTVHEVANGILRCEKSAVIFAPLPAGSANDYVHSLGLTDDWWRRPDPDVGPGLVDVGLVRSGARLRYFVNGFGAGFNALVTRKARRIRRLRGLPLYGLAVLRVIFFHYTAPVTTVRFDDGEARTTPMLGLSLALGRREGNFVVAPNASLDDGLFDYVHGGKLTHWGLLVFMAQMAAQRLPADHPFVHTGRCGRATLHSETPLIAHVIRTTAYWQ